MSLKVKKVHVTGVAGLLGSHVATRFLDRGIEVTGSDDLSGGYRDNVDRRCKFFKVNCHDLHTMQVILNGDTDVVVHAACWPSEGFSVWSPASISESVYGMTMSVATAAITRGVKRFVYMSSMSRYGSSVPPFTEDLKPAPVDPYGYAKTHAEEQLKLLSAVHGMDVVVLIPHNIIGPHQRYTDPTRNAASIMINMLLSGRRPIIYGDGTNTRVFSFVKDAVDCVERASHEDAAVGRAINIGPDHKSGEVITINELCRRIQRIVGTDVEPIHVDERPQEVKHAYCSSDLAREILGYETTVSLDDGLRQMAEWIRERGPMPFEYHLPLEIVTDKTPKTWTQRMF